MQVRYSIIQLLIRKIFSGSIVPLFLNRYWKVNCLATGKEVLQVPSTDREGLFSAAENGTIFLDEIGDLSLQSQVKILHAVEKKEIRQIGSSRTRPVNVRIVAATNRNIDAMMMQGTFREDLYYRISTFRINSPCIAGASGGYTADCGIILETQAAKKQVNGRISGFP